MFILLLLVATLGSKKGFFRLKDTFVKNRDMLLPSEATKHSEQKEQQHVYKLIVSWVWNTGYKHVSAEFSAGSVIFTITQDRLMLRCSECNSRHVICKGTKIRLFRMIPIGTKKVYLKFAIQRILCCLCGVIRQVKFGFADNRFSYTKGFERYVLELSGQ